MKLFSVQELCYKVLGCFRPIAETNTDNERYEHLKDWTEFNRHIIYELITCARKEDMRSYASSKQIVDLAREHLDEIYQWIKDERKLWHPDCEENNE